MLSIGVDVSKQYYDSDIYDGIDHKRKRYSNDLAGIRKFVLNLKHLDDDCRVIMEATGTYHYRLACALYEAGITVYVLNPFIIKRYADMRMTRTKTDRHDAKILAMFGKETSIDTIRVFKPKCKVSLDLKNILNAIEMLLKQRKQLKGQIEAYSQYDETNDSLMDTYREMIDKINYEIKKLTNESERLIKTHYRDVYDSASSIPGVGIRVISAIIAHYERFETFESSKEVVAFAGLNPRIQTSGTSVHKQAKISKQGSWILREKLITATLSAARHNKGCHEIYHRLKKNGKRDRYARIATARKLLRQIFAIVKSKEKYDENYLEKTRFCA